MGAKEGSNRLYRVSRFEPSILYKVSKEIIVTGKAHDVSYYVSNYIETGDPHNEER